MQPAPQQPQPAPVAQVPAAAAAPAATARPAGTTVLLPVTGGGTGSPVAAQMLSLGSLLLGLGIALVRRPGRSDPR